MGFVFAYRFGYATDAYAIKSYFSENALDIIANKYSTMCYIAFPETADAFSSTTTTTTNKGSHANSSYATATNPNTKTTPNETSPTRCCESLGYTVSNFPAAATTHLHLHPPSTPATSCSTETGLHSRGGISAAACPNRTEHQQQCSSSSVASCDADTTDHACDSVSMPWRMWLKRTKRLVQDIPWHQLRHVKWKNPRALGRSAYVPTDVSVVVS